MTHELELSNLSPSVAQRRFALGLVLVMLVVFVIVAGPLSGLPLRRVDAFIPAYGTAIFVIDSITAALLFAQFSVLRSHALLALANGYFLTALIAIPWTLTFPGVLAPEGGLGGGLQSTVWLYVLSHAGFALFVITYTLLKDADPIKWQPPWLTFVLAVSEQLHVEESELDSLPAAVHRFRQMPLPEEVVRLANEALGRKRPVIRQASSDG